MSESEKKDHRLDGNDTAQNTTRSTPRATHARYQEGEPQEAREGDEQPIALFREEQRAETSSQGAAGQEGDRRAPTTPPHRIIQGVECPRAPHSPSWFWFGKGRQI
ncbi:MAG: hypothetical protein MMC23_001416 [Stictis urceolatum]|nr:hypothetical protein [Stictis urceolata]